ncbi:MAG: hypothetical protein Q8N60_05235, partial [Candidatus Diapherotrites archaeon]|nr:hypothetical protein [Candidatus Diapherotrites archaeon]
MNAKLIAAALIFMAIASTANAATCTSIPQYGITWTFDKAYECGQFANGDYWVLGPVTILSITPDFDGSHHGWQSNPMPGYPQGFDSRASTFDPTLVPSLPYNAKPGESIVKSISIEPLENADCRPCLETAAVLTVLAAAPPDNGTTVFRPPYAGTEKPFYFANQLRTELLPMLQPVANTPTLETIKNNFQRVQLDHKLSWSGEYIRPKQNMASYGSGMAIRNAEGALRLMLNDSIEQKMPALINYVQAGIDLYGILKNGGSWGSAISGGGGHPHGRKLPIAFAAVLLNNQEMKDAVHNAGDNIFGENDGVKYSEKAGTVLYAEIECSELVYWKKHADELGIGPNASGSKTCKDPEGYIDGGGNPGSS